jgi:hypothetical protein
LNDCDDDRSKIMMIAYHTKKRIYATIMIVIMIMMTEYNIMIRIDTREDIQTSHSTYNMMTIMDDEMR